MSDLGFSLAQPGLAPPTAPLVGSPRPRVSLVEALGQSTGFRPDARFGGMFGMTLHERSGSVVQPDAPDLVAEAYARGFADGHAQASEAAEAHAIAMAAAHEALALAFTRLDASLEEDLRLRLRDTVAALCEAALAPLAIDEAALIQRITRAVSMLARADDERVVRLHPADIALISERMSAEWQVVPDASLERGTVRVEGSAGGVEDGPASWRMAIAEALHEG
ncbi:MULTISPECIES: FliH/SctL family protein [unclassified Novosphingobium]|uniref:FliH/SctL family protein n=1 Tax=unclassified Novosphingobium TaxID=2644732 RepID=UPI00135B0D65|nr:MULTISPECIES: FliH/SctL family protein [unclassified Novosphingobium]